VDLDPQRIAQEPAANLVAGAALLDDLRQRYTPGSTELDATWWPVVTAWSDAPAAWQRELFAAEVFNTLQQGLVAPTERMIQGPDAGEVISFAPMALPALAGLVLSPEPVELAPDYPAAVARHSGVGAERGAVQRVVVTAVPTSYAAAVAEDVGAHYVLRRGDGAVRQLRAESQVAPGAPDDATVIAVAGPGAHFGTWTPRTWSAGSMAGCSTTTRPAPPRPPGTGSR
jgi:hypothetical protein